MEQFRESITNEELAELPVAHFEGKITVIDREEQIPAACEYLSAQTRIGFDTETRPSFKPGVPNNRVALLQLSSADQAFLFRLNLIPFCADIRRILESPDILKIGAALPGDLRALMQLQRFRPGGFVDLQSIMGDFGIQEVSVRKMAAIILGTRVSKAQRLSNWEAVTLTPAQQMYAATDAWVCLEIHAKLSAVDSKAATRLYAPAPSMTKINAASPSSKKRRRHVRRVHSEE